METFLEGYPELANLAHGVRPFGDEFPGMTSIKRSRWRRVLGVGNGSHCYHVMSRLTDGIEFFEPVEKQALVVLLFKMARFCRVKVLTYCVMGNHFHALIEVPPKAQVTKKFRAADDLSCKQSDQPSSASGSRSHKPTDDSSGKVGHTSGTSKSPNHDIADDSTSAATAAALGLGWNRLFKHLKVLYSDEYLRRLRLQLDRLIELGQHQEVENIRNAFLHRMGDLPCFMRELKERFSKWLNARRGRRGSIWQGRYKSVLVQGNQNSSKAEYHARFVGTPNKSSEISYSQAMISMATYIDLNPVRAGIVDDPTDYPWCGYAAAIEGKRIARRGLETILNAPSDSWEADQVAAAYRREMSNTGWMPNNNPTSKNHRPSEADSAKTTPKTNQTSSKSATPEPSSPKSAQQQDTTAASASFEPNASTHQLSPQNNPTLSKKSMTYGHILGDRDYVYKAIKAYPEVFKHSKCKKPKRLTPINKKRPTQGSPLFSARNCDSLKR